MTGMKDRHDSREAPFPVTSWTLILEVQKLPEAKRVKVLGTLLAPYTRPIYAYYRWKGMSRHDAEDLVAEFICGFLEAPKKINPVERGKGKFRSWLLVCAHNLMVDRFRCQKKEPLAEPISEDKLADSAADASEYFNEVWARELLQQAHDAVASKCAKRGRSVALDLFVDYYVNNEERANRGDRKLTWSDIAKKHGAPSWERAAREADWVKAQFKEAIRAWILRYVESEEEIDDELRALLG